MTQRVILSVDPGTRAIGYCVWSAKKWGTVAPPIMAGTIESGNEFRRGFETGVLYLVQTLASKVSAFNVEQVYCEKMEFHASARGMAAAADVLGVAFFCGALCHWADERRASFHPVLVSEWKGQLSKEQVVKRLRNRLGAALDGLMTDPASHDWDALGIGLHAQERF